MRTAVRLEGKVYQSEFVSSPFILGVIRPRIYLPFGLEAGALEVAGAIINLLATIIDKMTQ